MNTLRNIVDAYAFTLVSLAGFAQGVTASGITLDEAWAQTAIKAKQAGSSYKITSARLTNGTDRSAERVK